MAIKQSLVEDRKGKYQFARMDHLVSLWANTYYPKTTILVIYECSTAFLSTPALNILKRDDLESYLLGLISDICFIEFDSENSAHDYILQFGHNKISYEIYKNGRLEETNITKPKHQEYNF